MRIFSKFKDYYDGIQGMGSDPSFVYIRNSSEIFFGEKFFGRGISPGNTKDSSFDKRPYPFIKEHKDRWQPSLRVRILEGTYVIGFCGKLYPLVKLNYERTIKENDTWIKKQNVCYCYSVKEIDEFVETYFRENQISCYRFKYNRRRKGNDWRRCNSTWSWNERQETFEEYFQKVKDLEPKLDWIFREWRCPIFLANNKFEFIRLNPCLKEWEFYRIFDTNQAFQEISMYLGNLAIPMKPIPEVSDIDLASAKGFDSWSFRKEPSKK